MLGQPALKLALAEQSSLRARAALCKSSAKPFYLFTETFDPGSIYLGRPSRVMQHGFDTRIIPQRVRQPTSIPWVY